MNSPKNYNAFAVWKIHNFRWLITGRFFLTMAIQMQSVVVGWQVYELTKDPFSLGLIGLAEVIPFLSVALYAGHIADIVVRRKIFISTTIIYVVCAALLLGLSYRTGSAGSHPAVLPLYLVIGFSGIARAFYYPAQSAYMAQVVPRELYPSSSSWNSMVWQLGAVSGPAVGGLVYGFAGIHTAYIVVVIFAGVSLLSFFLTRSVPLPEGVQHEGFMKNLMEGIRFVFSKQVLLGSMALDMFGVLFGGAVALLPVFAADILKVGPQGLGLLRAAPAIGAFVMSIFLTYYPPLRNTGYKLLTGAFGFGVCMILFAISKVFWISFLVLALSGMFDNISVIIRSTILQLYTPDSMRGRVASVNSLFIGSSNELGSFESGLAARIMGLVPSVVFGGGVTLVVVMLTSKLAPKLRKMELRKVG